MKRILKMQYSQRDQKFLEQNGRLIFLAFIKPIINGKGFDFKEVQVAQERRLDIVVTYLSYKYVIELKIWDGEVKHQKGLKQLASYLDLQSCANGYLVIFDFRKITQKEWKQEQLTESGKDIFAVWV